MILKEISKFGTINLMPDHIKVPILDTDHTEFNKTFDYVPQFFRDLMSETGGHGFDFTRHTDDKPRRLHILGILDVLVLVTDVPEIIELGRVFPIANNGDVTYIDSQESDHQGIFWMQTSAPDWNDMNIVAPSFQALLERGVLKT